MGTTLYTSAEELVTISAGARARGERCELVEGKVYTMSPAGWKHGKVVSRIHALLAAFITERDLGETFGAETGFLVSRSPDTVRAPDFAFIAKQNLPEEEPTEAYWPGAPDLAVEVLSPSDDARAVQAKTQGWMKSGVQLLWNIDYDARTVTAYRAAADPEVYSREDTLEAADLLPGLRVRVGKLFE